jgi:hypothetical protein
MARLVSVNVGLPRDVAWHGKTVYTSVWSRASRRLPDSGLSKSRE